MLKCANSVETEIHLQMKKYEHYVHPAVRKFPYGRFYLAHFQSSRTQVKETLKKNMVYVDQLDF